MAQENLQTNKAASYIGLESTFGTTPSMTRMHPLTTPDLTLEQEEIANDSESVYLHDYHDPVRGTQKADVKFSLRLAPHGTQLGSSTAPTTHPVQILLEAAFGGKQCTSGTMVTGAPTTGSVPVLNGALFQVGQTALFPVNSTLEPGRITAVSGNTLTVFPALSAAPSSGSAVINMENYFLTETNEKSVSFQHAKDSNNQWTVNGCAVGLDIKVEANKLATIEANLMGAQFLTGSQSIATTYASSTLAAPMAVKGATTLVQAITDGSRTQYPIESIAVKLNFGLEHLPQMGGVENKIGVMRTGGRDAVEATLKFRMDRGAEEWWNAQTKLQVCVMIPVGSGSTKRWIVLDMPTCVPVGKPKVDQGAKYVKVEMKVQGKLSQVNSISSTELSRSPIVLAVG